jgi:hypothetical protein
MVFDNFGSLIQHNCNISDARGSRVYSLCTLFLRLRSYYKWEKGLKPWDEPEPPELLDWIEAKESFWETLEQDDFVELSINGRSFDPFHPEPVNRYLSENALLYGAGYGRSLKPVFFLAEKLEEKTVEGCKTFILGRELHRELAAPFAMLQDSVIYVRQEPFRFYLWDQINDIRPSGKGGLQYALENYGLAGNGSKPDREGLIASFDTIVDQETDVFVYHEVGEMLEDTIDRELFRKIIAEFGGGPIELLIRAIKDILADTHAKGMLSHIINNRKKSSMGFYVTFLDGLRKVLFPEIHDAFPRFAEHGDWAIIDRALQECRRHNLARADIFFTICRDLEGQDREKVRAQLEKELLVPLGLKK